MSLVAVGFSKKSTSYHGVNPGHFFPKVVGQKNLVFWGDFFALVVQSTSSLPYFSDFHTPSNIVPTQKIHVHLYYLRSVPLVHFDFLVEVFLAFDRNVIRIL